MGQDINSLLIYGTIFTVEEIKKVMKLFGITDEDIDDSFFDAFDNFCKNVKIEFPSLYVEHASPYYDSEWEDWTIYVSMIDPYDTEIYPEDLNVDESIKREYENFISKFKNVEKASLYSIPHVW